MTGLPELASRHLGRGILAHPVGVSCSVTGMPGRNSGAPGATDDRRVLRGLRRAAEFGANFLDTSDFYGGGYAERLIGRFLRDYPDEHFRISSKVGLLRGSAPHPYAGRHIHHQLEQSLENLYVERLDVFTLESLDFGPGDRYLGGAIDQLHTLRKLGAIRAIGMRGPEADYDTPREQRAAAAARFLFLFRLIKPDVVWLRYHALTPALTIEGEDFFSFMAHREVSLVLADPLARGLLTGKGAAPRRSGRTSGPALRSGIISSGLELLRERFGHAPGALTQLAVRSCLRKADNSVVVCDIAGAEDVEEIYNSQGTEPTDADLALADQFYADIRSGLEREAQSVHEVRA
ncbi:aldo/keto reductase [Streptomyces sp. SBT349]|uniref:aldo/keto reductase n=1 Tax=Streptomyces sp. SBT349 TaxID=1580539 RepID=UPI00066D01EB|nr:aldo/keto reductase [Streptomyces sp. SBT349]